MEEECVLVGPVTSQPVASSPAPLHLLRPRWAPTPALGVAFEMCGAGFADDVHPWQGLPLTEAGPWETSLPCPPPELSGGWGIPSWLNCDCAQTGTLLWRSLCQRVGAGSGIAGHFLKLASTALGEVPKPVAVLTNQGAACTGKMVAGKYAADDTSEAGVGLRTATHIPPARCRQRYGLGPGHTGGPSRGWRHQCLQDTGGTLISQK